MCPLVPRNFLWNFLLLSPWFSTLIWAPIFFGYWHPSMDLLICLFLFYCWERVLDLLFIYLHWMTSFSSHIFKFHIFLSTIVSFVYHDTLISLMHPFSVSLSKIISYVFFQFFFGSLHHLSPLSAWFVCFGVCDRYFLKYLIISNYPIIPKMGHLKMNWLALWMYQAIR